jgi:hypothetical protein
MPSSSSFTGSSLHLLNVEQYAISAIKVTFSQDPVASSPVGVNDALNIVNYALSGPGINRVTSVTATANPESFLVHTNVPLLAGDWTLSVANIQTATASPLVAPTAFVFTATALYPIVPLGQGAVSPTSESDLRKFISPAIQGKNIEAMIAALATGFDYLSEIGNKAFHQLFPSTASGKYLDIHGSDNGILRPLNVGMTDRIYRSLLIQVSSEKVTFQSLLKVLEIFYGTDSTRAIMVSSVAEPYNLLDGDDLQIVIDGKTLTAVFHINDFQIPGYATATEVAAVITRALEVGNQEADAQPFYNTTTNTNFVKLVSGSLGLRGTIKVIGGRAQNILKFPTLLATTQTVGTQWKIEQPRPTVTPFLGSGRTRMTWIGGTDPSLQNIYTNDYANIYGSVFNDSNKGSFQIVSVVPGAVSVGYIEILNSGGLDQLAVTQTLANDILFFRPSIYTLNTNLTKSFASQASTDYTDVFLASTTQAVGRERYTGAYLHVNATTSLLNKSVVTSMTRAGATVTVNTATAHGLAAGDTFYLGKGDPQNGYFDGIYTVLPAPGSTTFTFTQAGAATPATVLGTIYPCYRNASGTVFIKTTSAHGLTTNDFVTIDGALADTGAAPPIFYTLASTGTPPVANTYFYGMVKLLDGRVFICGGEDAIAAEQASCYLYDPTTDTWSTAASMAAARTRHATVLLNNGRVLAIGGFAGGVDIATCEEYDPTLNAWSPVLPLNTARSFASAVKLNDGNVLIMGGGSATPELFDKTLNTWTNKAVMSTDRRKGGAVLLNSGEVFIAGGYPAVIGAPVATCQIYNPYLNTWDSTVPNMPVGVLSSFAITTSNVSNMIGANLQGIDGRVVIVGGTPDGTNPENHVQIYDPVLRTWDSTLQGSFGAAASWDLAIGTLLDGRIIRASGWRGAALAINMDVINLNKYTSNLMSIIPGHRKHGLIVLNDGSFLIGPGADVPFRAYPGIVPHAVGKLNGAFQVSVTGTNTFSYSTSTESSNNVITPILTSFTDKNGTPVVATVTSNKATQDINAIGPYIYDPKGPFGVTGITTTLGQNVLSGQNYNLLTVGSTAGFPTSGNFIINFGTKDQVGPIKYLFVLNATQLAVSSSYVFPINVNTGATITLLNNLGPYIPAHPESVGSFYLTDSIAGRISCSSTLDSIIAAGSDVRKTSYTQATLVLETQEPPFQARLR